MDEPNDIELFMELQKAILETNALGCLISCARKVSQSLSCLCVAVGVLTVAGRVDVIPEDRLWLLVIKERSEVAPQ